MFNQERGGLFFEEKVEIYRIKVFWYEFLFDFLRV